MIYSGNNGPATAKRERTHGKDDDDDDDDDAKNNHSGDEHGGVSR